MSSFQIGRSFDCGVETESEYLDSLYKQFRSMFVDCKKYWLDTNKVISFRREKEIDGRHASFWHAISGGSGAECDRELDLNRCRRLGWIGDLLDVFKHHYPHEDNFCWWKSPDPRWHSRRFLISTSTFNYIVVLKSGRTMFSSSLRSM